MDGNAFGALILFALLFAPIIMMAMSEAEHRRKMEEIRRPKDRSKMTEDEIWDDMSEGERYAESLRIRAQVELEMMVSQMEFEIEMEELRARRRKPKGDFIDAEFDIIDEEQPRIA